ncbi:MAG: phosphate ABC transporter substrate-binding protein [Candidatus Methylarchaceae archaeon HK01M]|nr:phosphate ABC transporter substrate-binding protein [Candidatus Methylarchaceae archaeon HK01M]
MQRNTIIAMVIVAIVIVAISLIALQFARPVGGELKIAGSTTVLPITQECARLYMEKVCPCTRISVSGGGSGTGIQLVGDGLIDIGAASRDLKPSELDQWPDLQPVAIGKDSVAIIVHPSNPIDDLTLEQIAQIFAGDITNWSNVGGEDAPINLITREEGSGTRGIFEEKVMESFGKEIAGEALVKTSNGEVRAIVATDDNSMAYLSLGYVDGTLKAISIGGIEATIENVLSEDYPIIRTLWLITKGTPNTLAQSFIDFVLSDEGQQVVEELGYTKVE